VTGARGRRTGFIDLRRYTQHYKISDYPIMMPPDITAQVPDTFETTDAAIARAWSVLELVADPEIPVVSIRELGILRDLKRASDGALEVVITPTYTGCPAIAQIAEDIGRALDGAALAPYRIQTALAPAWTTDWISDAARAKLLAYGIAPPTGQCAASGSARQSGAPAMGQTVRFITRKSAQESALGASPACPQCGSARTERLAQFGSTACKALYRCLDCREPFDYFKPY
jgi:ring-1,2-phenylacetyl-CoA epoxidase subunit PaaD